MEQKINEAAVWDRVSAAARSAEPDRGRTGRDTGPIGPDLLEAMGRERTAAQEHRQLAGRAGAEGQRVLRRIAVQEEQHSRTLGALYYLLTGQLPQTQTVQVSARQEGFREGLRRSLQSRELTAGRYEALAARTTGEVRQALIQLAQEEAQHFHMLLGLLKGCL